MQAFFYPYRFYSFHCLCLMFISLSSTSCVSLSYMVPQQAQEKTLLSGIHRDCTNTCSGKSEHTYYENILLAKLYSILSRLNEAVRSGSLFCPNHQFYCCSNGGSLYPHFSPNRDNEYKQQPQTEAAQNRTKMHVQAHFYGRKNILTLLVLIGMY